MQENWMGPRPFRSNLMGQFSQFLADHSQGDSKLCRIKCAYLSPFKNQRNLCREGSSGEVHLSRTCHVYSVSSLKLNAGTGMTEKTHIKPPSNLVSVSVGVTKYLFYHHLSHSLSKKRLSDLRTFAAF